MECESEYAEGFLKYLKDFVANIRSDDPLPVRAPSYKVTESEIDGQILDIVHHYLNSRECPPYVREYVGHRVWTAIRNPGVNGDGTEDEVDAATNTPNTNHNYDAMKLIQEVTGKANDVIRELSSSLTQDEVEKLPRYHPISHFAIKNTRRKMEDRHVIIHDLNTLYGMDYGYPHAYYGVFDGHAGTDAAVYSAAHLHQYMIQNPQYDTNPEAALKHAFHITDTNFIKKVKKEKLKGGTTAVVALVREKRLVVAWLGDSQALLVRRRNPVRMVEPHKPELPVERGRVEEMGGCVINIQGTWRVLGQLAVSRAIGDADYKPYVSSECDIKSLEIEGDEDFLILACDGLWDTLSAEDAVNVVYAYLTHNNGDTDGVGRCLVEAARSTGSEDNITAVVVFLRPVATLMEEEGQRIAQGQVPESIPAVLMEKDSTPSSINAIFSPPAFSPPINQFEISENSINKGFTSEDVDTVFGFNNHHDENQDGGVVAPVDEKEHVEGKDEPMEGSEAPIMPPHDSDSDEGLAVGAESTPITQDFNPHDAPTPTAEEVDAALAELDSIPDGVCEAGDVEEEEEDEEEWSYYRMEPQTQPQSDDILQGGASTTTTVPDLAHTEDVEVLPMPSDMVHDQDIIPVPKDQTEDIIQEQVLDHFEETNRDVEGNLSKEIPLQNELVDFDEKCPSPMETDLALVNPKSLSPSDTDVDLLTDITQSDIEKVIIEPSSPQGSGSPHVPGSPRSVEGFVTSVELNTPEETFGTNFAINQSQDPFSGVVDQTSGPFSVYVSSSPEPASLDPPGLAPVDLLNMNGGMSNGEEHALNAQASQPCDESPVEIVHAQSTVEVVAPPSPVDVSGPETQFILDSPPVPPADITFVPMPATEPSAEEPIPVYVDDTPVSEPDVIPEVETVPESTLEIQRETSETVFQVESASHMESTIDTNLELSQIPASSVPEASPDELVPVTPVLDTSLLGKPEVTPEQVPDLIISTPGGTDNVGALVTDIPEATNEVAEAAPVIVEAPVAAAKAESKVTKTKAKPTADKASPKTTLGKATPSRASSGKPTPTRSTPSKTPVTKTPTSRTPTAKITEKKTLAAKTTTQSTSRPSSVKATINKSATSTAEKVETSKQPRVKSTVTKAPLNTAPKPSSTTRASFARTPGTTASKTTTTTSAGAPKPARRIPATGTTTTARRPLSSSTSADKTDSSKLVNGSSLRPSQTATAARTTATTAARKPLASTKPPARPAAEKATKNTTNQMLSTRTTKSASPAGKTTTRTTAAHSTSRTTGKLNETTSSVKSRVTSASKASASKTTSAATKKTLVSKTSKTTALATKKSPAKTKTDDAVIESGEPVVNGENKIANEESSVEVIEKCAVEDNMQASAEKVISETVSSEQLIVSSETTEILVNGDH